MLNKLEDGCYFCGNPNVHKHHIFYGRGYRPLSEKYGMIAYLCPYHHNLSDNGVHFNKELDLELKQEAQRQFEAEHGHDMYMAVFGRNYL